MRTTKRRNIYFFPGIFAVIGLSIICYHIIESRVVRIHPVVLRIYLADLSMTKKYPESFTRFKGHFPPQRNYTTIDFTGNREEDDFKLKYAGKMVGEIVSKRDSLNGFHFKFSENSEFGTFVETINMLTYQEARNYMILDNEIWFYNFPRYNQ
jgi:hypothetical protein